MTVFFYLTFNCGRAEITEAEIIKRVVYGKLQLMKSHRDTVLVSGCIVGMHCRYNGATDIKEDVMHRLKGTNFVPLCPEQLGGLPTPRPKAWIASGDGADVLSGRASIINEAGEDVTNNFIRGAREVELIVKLIGIKSAYMKSKSPSCGFGKIWRGDELVDGNGVCAMLLAQNNVEIITV